MKEFITAESVFMNAVMQRQTSDRLLLLLEGEDEDLVFSDHVYHEDIQMLVMGGKPQVLKAAKLVDKNRIWGIKALIDRDLDDLTGASDSYPETVVATNSYDLLADAIAVDPRVILRPCKIHSRPAFSKVQSSCSVDFLELAVRLAHSLTPFRLANAQEGWGLNMRDFPFRRILTQDFTPAEPAEVYEIIASRSKNPPSWDVVGAAIQAQPEIPCKMEICGGHDLVGAACALLALGGATQLAIQTISRSLIVAIDCSVVMQLPVYQPIAAWGRSHSRTAFTCDNAA